MTKSLTDAQIETNIKNLVERKRRNGDLPAEPTIITRKATPEELDAMTASHQTASGPISFPTTKARKDAAPTIRPDTPGLLRFLRYGHAQYHPGPGERNV